ncbi:hypothetical protein [Streptomyces albidoflavus]|uniref:hypothetical protein n=1 Tax=Streptomyces albidoflavus TaxID=1886 RepID=UPI0033EB5C70
MTTPTDHPYRVADREGEGWLRNGPDDTYTTFPRSGLANMTYEQLEADRGPLRPVVAMAAEDRAELAHSIAQAGKKGMASFLAGLYRTACTLIEDGSSIAVLTSGRPGSWEANLLRGSIAWLGEGISDSRIDESARRKTEDLLYQWTTGPVQVELAEGLVGVLADAAMQAGGWDQITDRWLKNGESLDRWTSRRL